MTIAEFDFGGVSSDGLNSDDADQALTENQLLLARPMAFHFSAGAFNAKQLGGNVVRRSIIETDFQAATVV